MNQLPSIKPTFIVVLSVMIGCLYSCVLKAEQDVTPKETKPDEYVVLLHRANNNSTLTIEQVQRLFLGKERSFPDGSKAVPINLRYGSSARKAFNRNVLNKNHAQLKSYWVRQVFTGISRPPRELENDQEMIEWIKNNEMAIGYVDPSALSKTSNMEGIKVIKLEKPQSSGLFGSD